jgi:hypothetical protein
MSTNQPQGSPEECLAVLMDLGSHVTILGPASEIELVEGGEGERQVLRICVEATGMARRCCAPREVVVERVSQAEDSGVNVVLFSSIVEDDGGEGGTGSAAGAPPLSPAARGLGAAATAQRLAPPRRPALLARLLAAVAAFFVWLFAWVPMLFGRGGARGGHARAPARRRTANGGRRRGMWVRPVLASVRGGYTISPRETPLGEGQPPECLVTCILKVDLGGAIGERSWLRPLLDALGWVDAYIERMLMAVILVKDEIEQRRFLVQPFMMLSEAAAPPRRHRRRRRGAGAGGGEGGEGEGEEGARGRGGAADAGGDAREGSPARALARASSAAAARGGGRGLSPPPTAPPTGRLAKMASRMRRVWGRRQPKPPKPPVVRAPSQRTSFVASALSLLPFGGGGDKGASQALRTTSGGRGSERGSLFAAALALTPFGSSSNAGAGSAAAAAAAAARAASLAGGELSASASPAPARGSSEQARAAAGGSGDGDADAEGRRADAAAAAEEEQAMEDWYQGGPQGPAAKLAKLPPQ